MTFERGLWAEAWRNFLINKWIIVTIIVTLMVVQLLEDAGVMKAPAVIGFIWVPLAFAAHATILRGSNDWINDKGVWSPFVGWGLALALIGLVPAALVIFLVWRTFGSDWLMLAFLLFYGVFEALVLAKWGTLLPAIVAGGERSFAAASGRGSHIFGYALSRLLLGNGGVLLGAFLVLTFALAFLGSEGVTWIPGAGFQWATILVFALFDMALAFQTVMLATILSRAYLIAEAQKKEAPAAASAS